MSRKRWVAGDDGWISFQRRKKSTRPQPPPPARSKPYRKPPQRPTKLWLLFPQTNPPAPSRAPTSNPPKPFQPTYSKSNSHPTHPASLTKTLAAPSSYKLSLLSQPKPAPQLTMAANSSTAASSNPDGLFVDDTAALPPPDPSHRSWKGRCFKCLRKGHTQAFCRQKVRSCPRCRIPGHGLNHCPRDPNRVTDDPLAPRGHLGGVGMPLDRPPAITAYIPQSPESIQDLQSLTSAVVIDARLKKEGHSPEKIQAVLMAAVDTNAPYRLQYMSADRYIFILPDGVDRQSYISDYLPYFRTLGYVIYPWSPRIDSDPIDYRFKVWIDLHKVPITAWNRTNLLPLVSQFGLLLDHTPFEGVTSLSLLRVVVAVEDLSKVPLSAFLVLKALKREISLDIVGWVEELHSIRPPLDPTPPPEYFEELKRERACNPIRVVGGDEQANLVPLDFGTLFGFWRSLEPSPEKDRLQEMLSQTPLWDVYHKRELLKTLASSSPPVSGAHTPASDARPPTPPLRITTTPLQNPHLAASDPNIPSHLHTHNSPLLGLPSDPLAQPVSPLQGSLSAPASDLVARAQALDLFSDQQALPLPPAPSPCPGPISLDQRLVNLGPQSDRALIPVVDPKEKRPLSATQTPTEVCSSPMSRGKAPNFSPSPPPPGLFLWDVPVTANFLTKDHLDISGAIPVEVASITSPPPLKGAGDQDRARSGLLTPNVHPVAGKKPKTQGAKVPKEVLSRISKAELERCLTNDALVKQPLSVQERSKVREACGLILQEQPTAADPLPQDDGSPGPCISGLNEPWPDLSDVEEGQDCGNSE